MFDVWVERDGSAAGEARGVGQGVLLESWVARTEVVNGTSMRVKSATYKCLNAFVRVTV